MSKEDTIFSLMRRLWLFATPQRKLQLALLLVLMILGIFAELFSIGMVLPFLSVLLSPEKVFDQPWAQFFIDILDLTSPDQVLLPVTIIFGVVVVFAGVLRFALLWMVNRFANYVGNDIGSEAYRRTLYQPYSVHVGRNNVEIGAIFVKKIDVVIYSVILPFLMLFTSLLLVVSIVFFLMFINPKLTCVVLVFFGGLYVLVALFAKRYLSRDSRLLAKKQGQVARVVQEGLGGIRDVLLDRLQETYFQIYKQVDGELRYTQSNIHIFASVPRPIVEAFSLVLLSIMAYFISGQEGGLIASMPTLGALVLAAQRMLPLIQNSYTGWSYILGGKRTLIEVLELLEQPLPEYKNESVPSHLSFENQISIKNLDFSYAKDSPLILKNIELQIPRGSRVGFIGPTGCGKSSLMDMLMGLLTPSNGQLLVDGIEVNESNYTAWQAHIAHVPQSIFLADATVAENIAFGKTLDEIDWDQMEAAAEKAQIAETVKSFEEGYETMVGENGIRLSGGQRQRLGLARAFYKQADVLVLDEATSALDSETETFVMNSIDKLDKDLTVLIVAHRVTTLSSCDKIFELKEGKIIRSGTYNEMFEHKSYG